MKSFRIIQCDIESLSHKGEALDQDLDQTYPRMHDFNNNQRILLEKVIEIFPCFAGKGLDKSSLEPNSIDTGNALYFIAGIYRVGESLYGESLSLVKVRGTTG